MSTARITILSGTNRPGSNTRKVAGRVESIYRELGVDVQLLDLAKMPAEIFAPSSYAEKPAAFARFTDAILGSDGLVVVTPEYNGGMPGVLKYFIDMLPFPESFERRPVCFVGLAAGMWGALRPVEQLQAIFGYRNACIFPERVFMPGIGRLLDDSGALTDAKLVERLREQAQGFTEFVGKLKA
jgi:chromate reductase, NAD(P)H dehydrogenase (quinone)